MIRHRHRPGPAATAAILACLVPCVVAGGGEQSRTSDDDLPIITLEQAPIPLPAQNLPEPVDVEDAVLPLRVQVPEDFGYEGTDGVLVIDLVETEFRHLQVMIEDAEGRPVRGAVPTVTTERDSRFVAMGDEGATSDRFGEYWFGLVGGSMGDERLEVTFGDAMDSAVLNIISKRAKQYGWLEDIEGVLDWSRLLEADIERDGEKISATFPDDVQEKNGQTVKLAGFMLPIETALKQGRFVLVSNPPGCFFHIPGGPAGAVEIYAKKPLEMSWDPVVLEGRFEALEADETGVVYRLHDARSVPVKRAPG